MIELLIPHGFHTLEYSWLKVIICICTLTNYSVAKEYQQRRKQRKEMEEDERLA
jgi:hypothetical protein